MHFAAPLPVGCGSEADLLDVSFDVALDAAKVETALTGLTPRDLSVVAVTPTDEQAPSLSDRLQETIYRVWLRDVTAPDLQLAVAVFLSADSVALPRRGRRHRGKTYDLRPLVLALALDRAAPAPWVGLQMRLKARPGATGRPDEVLKALGLSACPRRCSRTGLILEPLAPSSD
jgi:radical SAM-linked protein